MSTTHQADAGCDQPLTDTAEAAEALCDRLMDHTGDLMSLLDRETALLQRGKAHEITALQARKTALSSAMMRDMEVFRRDADFVRAAAPARVDAIRDQHQHLQRSLRINQDALVAMKAVTESLLHTIAAKAGEQRTGPEVYGKDAGLSGSAPVGPAAISVDTTL